MLLRVPSQAYCCLVTELCPTLLQPMDCICICAHIYDCFKLLIS